jgi:hypothetical protein
MIIEFKTAIGARVQSSPHVGVIGTVKGLFCDRHGNTQALLEYVDRNGVVHAEYFDEDDLIAT